MRVVCECVTAAGSTPSNTAGRVVYDESLALDIDNALARPLSVAHKVSECELGSDGSCEAVQTCETGFVVEAAGIQRRLETSCLQVMIHLATSESSL